MMADGLDARNFRGGRIQASGGGTNTASGFSRAAPRLLRRAPERKGGRTRERERENREEGEKRGGGTAGGCAVGFSDEEEIGRGRSREWAAFGKGGAGRGAHGAGLPGRDGRGQGRRSSWTPWHSSGRRVAMVIPEPRRSRRSVPIQIEREASEGGRGGGRVGKVAGDRGAWACPYPVVYLAARGAAPGPAGTSGVVSRSVD